jgi:hypothetical protein
MLGDCAYGWMAEGYKTEKCRDHRLERDEKAEGEAEERTCGKDVQEGGERDMYMCIGV